MFSVRPSGMRLPENRLMSSSYWRTASRGKPRQFSQDLSLPLLTQRQPNLESGRPPPGPTLPRPPQASAEQHRALREQLPPTGSSNFGSRTGNLIYTEKQDEKLTFADDHIEVLLFFAVYLF